MKSHSKANNKSLKTFGMFDISGFEVTILVGLVGCYFCLYHYFKQRNVQEWKSNWSIWLTHLQEDLVYNCAQDNSELILLITDQTLIPGPNKLLKDEVVKDLFCDQLLDELVSKKFNLKSAVVELRKRPYQESGYRQVSLAYFRNGIDRLNSLVQKMNDIGRLMSPELIAILFDDIQRGNNTDQPIHCFFYLKLKQEEAIILFEYRSCSQTFEYFWMTGPSLKLPTSD